MRKTLQRTFGLLFFALVGVMTGTAQNSFPYSVDFTTAGDLAGWTAVDDSPTKGVTWAYGTGTYSQADAASKMCALMSEDANSKHVDYLVSPEFTATAGATYYISIKAQYKGYARCGVQAGKSATDMSANAVISDDVSGSFGKYNNGWFDYKGVERAKTAKVAYTATEDGPLYFSLYAHSMLDADDGDFFYVYGIDIVEDKPGPKALPYSVDLGDNQRGWAALDASDVPGVTWAEGEFYDNTSDKFFPGVVNKHDFENTWNDYYVSPAFTLEAGKSYKVKTRTWKNTDPSAFTLSLMLGTSQTDASTFQKITDLEMQAVYDATATEDHVFAVGKGGDYNLAFLATTTTATDEVIALSYFDIAETDETPEITIGGGSEGPETTALPYNITFDSADKFATWSTLDNSDVPGKTWEFNASDFAGKPSAFMGPDAGSATSDWLISPEFELQEGKTYVIKMDGNTGTDNATSVTLDYFEGSKDKDNAKTIAWIGSSLPMTDWNTQEPITEWAFEVTKSGSYYFGIHAQNWTPNQEKDAISIYSFSVAEQPEGEPETPVALPYETSFLEETGAAGWTAMDRSDNAKTTWAWNSWGYTEYDENWQQVGETHPCVGFSSDWDSNANDYFVSPLFTLEAGKTYVVKTHTATNRSCFNDKTTSFTMKLGTNKKVQGTFTQSIGDIELNTVYDRDPSVFEFTVEENGNYYVAYNISDPDGKKAYGYIFDFSIAEKVVPDVTAELPYEITFDSADKFATWSTLDNSDVPGKTWEFNASDFAGKPSAFMGPDAGSATCDWLISPKFELKEGKSYVIKFDGATGADNATSVILDYFEGSKDKDNFKSITWIGEKLPKMEGEEAKTEWTVDINKDGSYYFAFRALNHTPNQETDAISIYSFSVAEAPEGEPETPVALPYETSFLEETGAAGWTAMDRSDNAKTTWAWNSWGYTEYDENWQQVGETHPCVGFSSDWDSNANDYFVSPLFTLEAGKTYVVKTHTATNRSCFNDKTTSFTMKLGTNKKVQGTFTQSIGDIELNTVYDRDPSVFEFSVEESGNYYVAYNISDPDGKKAYGYIFDFSLAEKTAEVQPVATTPVTDLAATEAGDLKTIKLKWKNPTKDVDGNDLAADAELSVKVFEGETLLTTVAGAPGAEGSYSYEPETYAGLHEYKVVVVYNELESEAATATLTVVVNGINGAIVIPAGAEVSVRTLGGALVGNNFSTLAKGTYLVTVKTVDGKVKTMKVTK